LFAAKPPGSPRRHDVHEGNGTRLRRDKETPCLRGEPLNEGRETEHSIGRKITLALLFKFAFLIALYLAFFRGDQRPSIDTTAAAEHLLEAPR